LSNFDVVGSRKPKTVALPWFALVSTYESRPITSHVSGGTEGHAYRKAPFPYHHHQPSLHERIITNKPFHFPSLFFVCVAVLPYFGAFCQSSSFQCVLSRIF